MLLHDLQPKPLIKVINVKGHTARKPRTHASSCATRIVDGPCLLKEGRLHILAVDLPVEARVHAMKNLLLVPRGMLVASTDGECVPVQEGTTYHNSHQEGALHTLLGAGKPALNEHMLVLDQPNISFFHISRMKLIKAAHMWITENGAICGSWESHCPNALLPGFIARARRDRERPRSTCDPRIIFYSGHFCRVATCKTVLEQKCERCAWRASLALHATIRHKGTALDFCGIRKRHRIRIACLSVLLTNVANRLFRALCAR
mmetsp:Transcript_54478/g.127249  ORF Transcript_54478/g.127249 Transcript_54478/m.127249 type:complete len:261 (+) Transcript_54478:199-981(+)